MIKGKINIVMILDWKLLVCVWYGLEYDLVNDVIRGVYKY